MVDLDLRLLSFRLLDLLVDGPSSFAALYGSLVRVWQYDSKLDVVVPLDALIEMEKQGFVQALQMTDDGSFRNVTSRDRRDAQNEYARKLPGLADVDLSYDEVGLWYGILDRGREEWQRWARRNDDGVDERWSIDVNYILKVICVKGSDSGTVERALSGWIDQNPRLEVIASSKAMEYVAEFQLRDGTRVKDGVKLLCKFRESPDVLER